MKVFTLQVLQQQYVAVNPLGLESQIFQLENGLSAMSFSSLLSTAIYLWSTNVFCVYFMHLVTGTAIYIKFRDL